VSDQWEIAWLEDGFYIVDPRKSFDDIPCVIDGPYQSLAVCEAVLAEQIAIQEEDDAQNLDCPWNLVAS
jgi:hypothetical protein